MKYLTKEMTDGKSFQRFDYPRDMDADMTDLMDVINNIPGCRSLYCCQGHGDGGWYFVVRCASRKAAAVILDYFRTARSGAEVVDSGWQADSLDEFVIPERQISVYDESFDSLTACQKKKAYAEMCRHLLKFVPRSSWFCKKRKRRIPV